MIRIVLLLFALFPSTLYAGSLYFSPETGSYRLGEQFEMRILLDTADEAINAAEADIAFDPRDFLVDSISQENSILTLWSAEPRFSNESGTITFSGWTEEPYRGKDGLLATVRLRALRTDTHQTVFAAGAALAAGERGSNIVTALRAASYFIAPAESGPSDVEVLAAAAAAREPYDLLDPPLLIAASPLEKGAPFLVRGRTLPNAHIRLTALAGETVYTGEPWSNEEGAFAHDFENMPPGVYRISALVSHEGNVSAVSEPVLVEVREKAHRPLLIPTLVAGVVFFLFFFLFYREHKRAKRKITVPQAQ